MKMLNLLKIKNKLKVGSVHENIRNNDQYSDEILQKNDF